MLVVTISAAPISTPNSVVLYYILILSTPGARTLVLTTPIAPETKLIPNPTAVEIQRNIREQKQRSFADTLWELSRNFF